MTNNLAQPTAIVTLAAELPAGTGRAGGDWIKITPRGPIQTRDGRPYSFDPEMLAGRFASEGVAVPMDLDHAIARLASQGQSVPAIGWIEDMEARPDGLYGRVEWLDAGKAALAARSHRYVSPTFHHDAKGAATWLHSVALVTAPALSQLPAVASADVLQPKDDAMLLDKLRKALSLASDADEAAILAAIAKLTTAELAASSTNASAHLFLREIARERGAEIAQRTAEKVDVAIRRGVFPPHARDAAIAMSTADPKLYDDFVTTAGTPLAYLSAPAITPAMERRMQIERDMSQVLDPEANLIAAQLGIPLDSLKGER